MNDPLADDSVAKSQKLEEVFTHSTAEHMAASVGVFSPKCNFCIKMIDDMMTAVEAKRLEKEIDKS